MTIRLNNLVRTGLLLITVIACSATQGYAQLIPSFGDARSGTSGFQFMKISVDPRSASMGNSVAADATDGSALYWNPALASQIEGNEVMLSYTSYFAGISQSYASYIQQIGSISIGASLQFLDSGDITETTEFYPFGTGRTFKTVHYSIGLSASQRLTNYFSYGLTLRFLDERIENVKIQSGAIDFGFFYRVTDTDLRFAVSIKNFGLDASPSGSTERLTLDGVEKESDFETVSLPTSFVMAAAYDVYTTNNLNLLLTAQLTKPSDNAERFSLGGEFSFMGRFHLRTGYEFGVEEILYPSVGFGVQQEFSDYEIYADVSYTAYDRLGNLPRLSLRFSF